MTAFTRVPFGLPVATLLTLALLAPLGWARAEPVGFVAAFEGSVEIQAAGSTSGAAAVLDSELALGDTLRTAPSSALKLLLADGTALTLGESTDLRLDSRDPSVLKLLQGEARLGVGQALGGLTRVELHTPTAVIAVEDGEFEVYVSGDSSTGPWTLVCNLRGSLFVRQIGEETGRRLELRPERCMRIFRERLPSEESLRPAGFALLPLLSSRPAAGLAELLGRPGVASAGAGSGGKLGDFVISWEPDRGGARRDEGGPDPETTFIEDAVQAAELRDKPAVEPSDPPDPPECPVPEPLCPPPSEAGQ